MLRNSTSMAQNDNYHATDEFITITHVMPVLWDEKRRNAIIEEHRGNPIGKPGKAGRPVVQHSDDLARVLDKLRRAPLPGRSRCTSASSRRLAPTSKPARTHDRCRIRR